MGGWEVGALGGGRGGQLRGWGRGAGWLGPGQVDKNKGFSPLLSEAAESLTAWGGKTLRVTHDILHTAQVLGLFPAQGFQVHTWPRSSLAGADHRLGASSNAGKVALPRVHRRCPPICNCKAHPAPKSTSAGSGGRRVPTRFTELHGALGKFWSPRFTEAGESW